MAFAELTVSRRADTGKGVARKLRAGGFIPGTYYGPGKEPVSLSIDPKELRKLLLQASANQFLLNLKIDGQTESAMLKEFQIDPVSRRLVHADFMSIKADEAITLDVYVEFTGEPAGTGEGGLFEIREQYVSVSGLPAALPESIAIDVSGLNIGDTIKAADLAMPEGIELISNEDLLLCAVTAPITEEEMAVEGEEGEEGAEEAGEEAAAEGAEEEEEAD